MGKRLAEKMPLSQRAKQFAPFDALKGFKEAIQDVNDKAELVDRIIMSEDQLYELDEKVHSLKKGRYIRLSGVYNRIDEIERTLQMTGEEFLLNDIIEIHKVEE